MAWVSGSIIFEKPSAEQNQFKGDIVITQIDTLAFHGIVKDSDGEKPVEGALVKVFARLNNGREEALSQTLTGSDGFYLLYIDKKKIPVDAAAIVVRVGGNGNSCGEEEPVKRPVYDD